MSDTRQEQSLENILAGRIKEVIKNENLKDCCDVQINPIPCSGRNYTGAIYLITLKDKDKGRIELFAKIANITEHVRQFMPVDVMYGRERWVYVTLAKIYEELQAKHNIPEESRFKFSKYYYSNESFLEESVILENLTAKGYNCPDRFESMTWDFAAKAVKELAKFHALSFAFEKAHPELFEEMVKGKNEFIITNNKVNEDEKEKYQKHLFQTIFESLNHSENCDRVKTFVGNLRKETWLDMYKVQRRPVLTHGDYRVSNLMAKYEGDEICDVIPVDYQTVHYGSPINDLMYFIFTGTDEKFRKNYYDLLLEHYYNCLTDFLALLGLDVMHIYPKEEYNLDLKERTLYGFLISIFILPYILVEEKPDFNKKIEDFSIKQGNRFGERLNGIVNDFVKWEIL